MRRNVAELRLHGGDGPSWPFERMTGLAGAITAAVVEEHGRREMLRRLSDPWWFQAFGCVLGFDWHSTGLTTVTCGAVKEAFRRREKADALQRIADLDPPADARRPSDGR